MSAAASPERRAIRSAGYTPDVAPLHVALALEDEALERAATASAAAVTRTNEKVEAALAIFEPDVLERAYAEHISALEALVSTANLLADIGPVQRAAHRTLADAGALDTPAPEPMSVRASRDRHVKALRDLAFSCVAGDI
jgi:hypothetical protein